MLGPYLHCWKSSYISKYYINIKKFIILCNYHTLIPRLMIYRMVLNLDTLH